MKVRTAYCFGQQRIWRHMFGSLKRHLTQKEYSRMIPGDPSAIIRELIPLLSDFCQSEIRGQQGRPLPAPGAGWSKRARPR